MSSFTNIEKTNNAMSKRKKRSSTQFVQDAFIEKADGESDGAIVKTTQQLTIRKRVRGKGREQQRAGKIATAKLNN